MPELCLGKLVRKMLEAVARVTVAPTSAAFSSVFHPYPRHFMSGRSHAVALHLYGRTRGQSASSSGQCWACSRGPAPAALGKAWPEPGARTCRLRTTSLKHLLWSLAETAFSTGPALQYPEERGAFSQGDCPARPSSLPLRLKSGRAGPGGRRPRLPKAGTPAAWPCAGPGSSGT